jgi:hypothetical protein
MDLLLASGPPNPLGILDLGGSRYQFDFLEAMERCRMYTNLALSQRLSESMPHVIPQLYNEARKRGIAM